MSQFDFGTIDPNSKSGPQLALDLNKFRDALNSGHRGSARPDYAQAGMQWVRETSSTQWDLMLFDGDADFVLRSVNPETNTLLGIPQSQIEGLGATFSDLDSKYVGKNSATGAATLPSGTTAQRPASPVAGMTRYNTTLAEYERYQGGAWVPFNVMDKALNEAPIVTLASAATVNIGAAAANTISISGATTISAFDTIAAGAIRRLVFQGALTLTYNSASLILPGAANITTTSGDVAEFLSLGSGNWRCVSFVRANGVAISGLGVGQVWVDVTSSRSSGTTFTNTTARPIAVNITQASASATTLKVEVGGVLIHDMATSSSGTRSNASFVVPVGSTYKVTATGSGISVWAELR